MNEKTLTFRKADLTYHMVKVENNQVEVTVTDPQGGFTVVGSIGSARNMWTGCALDGFVTEGSAARFFDL